MTLTNIVLEAKINDLTKRLNSSIENSKQENAVDGNENSIKRSTTPNSKPQVADLRNNEIALNIPDRKLFINNNGTVEELLNGAPNDETIIPSMFVQSITDGVGNEWFVSLNGTDKAQVGGNNPLNTAAQNTNQWCDNRGHSICNFESML